MSKFIFVLAYYLIGYRKKVVRENMHRSFPSKTAKERKHMERKFYLHFCELFLLSMKTLTISKRNALKRLKFKNIELLNDYFDQGKNVVLYSAHMGNWEWFAFMPLFVKHQFVSFYQKQSNPYFNAFTILMRQRFGNICVESRTAYKQLMQLNREGVVTLAYIIGDQSPMENSGKIWSRFLNQDSAFLAGADRIARKADQIILYPHIRRVKNTCYEVEFKEIPVGTTQEVVDAYAQFLEANIIEQPELWLWTHRRWKLKPDQATD